MLFLWLVWEGILSELIKGGDDGGSWRAKE